MENEPHVRIGQPDDIIAIMKLAEMAVRENAVGIPDMKKIGDHIWTVLTNPGPETGVCGVIGHIGDDLEGMTLLRVGPLWYGIDESPVLEEKVVFVHPDFRVGKVGRARLLVEFAIKASDEWSLPLAIGVLSSKRTEAKARLYRRLLGEPAGVYFLHNAKTGME